MGCLCGDVRGTPAIPQRAADFAALQQSTALGQLRIKDPVHNAKRAIEGMQRDRARWQGRDLQQYQDLYASRQPNVGHGIPATIETVQTADRRIAGEGGENLTERSAASQRFFANRGARHMVQHVHPAAPRIRKQITEDVGANGSTSRPGAAMP
jgi:hypothetical protein